MAEKVATTQNSDLKCPSCFKKMTEPRALKCFHLFCQPCTDDMELKEGASDPSYQCPICGESTSQKYIQRLERIEELLGMVQTTKPDDLKCSQCKEKVPTKRCLDCKDNFCTDCQEAHNKWAMLAHHKWAELSEAPKPMIDRNEYCLKHPQERIKLRCKDCKELICFQCGCENHKTHKIEDIDSVIKASQDATRAKIDQVQHILKHKTDLLTNATLRGETIKQNYEEMEKHIDKKCEEIMKKARKDCKLLKDQLQEKKNDDFGSIEKYRNQLESEIQTERNTMILGELALSNAHGTSFLYTVNSGIGATLDRRIKDRTTHWALHCRPGKQFSEETNIPANIIGQVALQSSRKLNCRLADLANLRKNELKSTTLPGHCSSFIKIGNELFFNHIDTNKINVHNLNGVHSRAITYKELGKCNSITKTDREVLIASDTGLYSVDLNGNVIATILKKHVDDVSVLGDTVFALSNDSKVHIIKKNHNNDYSFATDFDLGNYSRNAKNTILATQDYIYVAQYNSYKLDRYSHSGIFQRSFQGSDDYYRPRIAGVDEDDVILLFRSSHCSHSTNRENTLTITLSKEGVLGELQSMKCIYEPHCAIIEGDELWIVTSGNCFKRYQLK